MKILSSIIKYDKSFQRLEDNSIKIGSQIWSTRNLEVTTFRNGDPIPEAKTYEEWQKATKADQPAWCYYDKKVANGETYGKLYNWYAVNDPRGLSPAGWHVPSDEEWTVLSHSLGGDDIAGKKLKANNGWFENGNGDDQSGFWGLPGGSCNYNLTFFGQGKFGYWWSTTESHPNYALYRGLNYSSDLLVRIFYLKCSGLSVRCVRD